jgi:hypothetical protein
MKCNSFEFVMKAWHKIVVDAEGFEADFEGMNASFGYMERSRGCRGIPTIN